MSSSFHIYLREHRPISREAIAAGLREGNWDVVRKDGLAILDLAGELQSGDVYYGADSERVSREALTASIHSGHLEPLWETSGGEAIVSLQTGADIRAFMDIDDVLETLTVNEPLGRRLAAATVHIEIEGGSYFGLELSQVIAKLGGGVWENPENGETEIFPE